LNDDDDDNDDNDVHAPTESQSCDENDSFYEELERVFD
jgi:hypothetical protein